jgi:uncharacterized protein involved in type VI secretion and phage assembly
MNHFKGVVPGLVKSLDDPDGFGRIQVHLPRLPGENRTFWASVAAPMAGGKRGFFFHPEIEDEVLVAFDEGDPHHPYIVGFLWNGVDQPPPGANASVRRLRTVSGHILEFDDRAGDESILIKTQGGQQIRLSDSPTGKIAVETAGQLKLTLDDTTPPSIKLEGGGRTLLMQSGQLQIL